MSAIKNKIHYYKSKLNRGYTSLNVYDSKENDYIKNANFTEGSVSNGVFVQATRWQQKLNAQAVKDESDGYGFPKDIKLPSIKVGVADNANINTDMLKARFKPSFISTNGTNFKTINAGAYKLLDAVQETNPFYEEAIDGADPVAKSVAVGTKTSKIYILLMLDNSLGIYTMAENFSALVRPFLVGGQMNWLYEDKSVTGYRGVKGEAFPVRLGITNENPAGTEDGTRDGIVSGWEFKFNQALDPVCPSMVTKEGSLGGKPYKMQMITFGSFTGQDVPNFHEDKITAGLNIKGVIGIYQLGETEADRANFIDCKILKSTEAFTVKEDGTQVSQDILSTLAGQGLISTENLRLLSLTDSDKEGQNPIYALGMHYPLSYLYDITLGQHNEGDVPAGASVITAFEEQKEWDGVETKIVLDQTLSASTDEFVIKAPVVCYPKLEFNAEVTDAVGAIASPSKPNQLHFVEAKECLAFNDDLSFLWDTAQTNDEGWSDDEKQSIIDKIKEAEDYNTGLYSYNTMIEAIKAVFLARTESLSVPEELSAEREAVYESLFKRKWNGGSETDNVLKDAYEVECWTPFYCDEPITCLGLTENSVLDNPSYLLWNSALTEVQVPVTSHIHNDAEMNGYYKPKGVVAGVANVIFGAKALSETEVKADMEYARVWKDLEGKESMKSALVEDLYSLKELYDQMNKQGVPILDTTRSEFFKALCYGRVKDKMPIGAWWFMNCHKDAWIVEDSIIDSVWWEKGENFDDYLYAEESDNPDLNCKTVSFRVKDGVIDTDYFEDKNAPKIYCSIYYCASAKNGKETKQEFRFEIVEPIVIGLLTRVRQQTGITNNMWSQGAYANIGQFWFKKWINRPLSELDKLGIQPKDRLFHINNCAMGMTPRYMCYKHEPSKRYELPILAVPAWVMNEDSKLDVDKRKYNRFEVTATDGSKHIIPVSAMNTDTKDARFTAGLSADADTDFGGGGSYHVDNYSLVYGYGVGLEQGRPIDEHLVDFGAGLYIRDRVLCSSYAAASADYASDYASASASLCPIYIESSPNQLNLQPENFQYRKGSWGAGGRTSSFKAECSNEWFNEFCDTRYGVNGYPKADKWLRIEQIYIPASDKTDNSGYLVTRWMWEGEDFKEADLYDNSKWKEMLNPVKDGYIIFARGKRPIHLIADWNCWITDISAIKIYQIGGLIKDKKLPKATATDKASERLAKTTQYANAIYSALQDLDASIASGLLEPKFDITRDECRYGEFMQFDENHDPIGHNCMSPNSAQWCYDALQWSQDINWLPWCDDGFKGQHPQLNMNYSGQVQGFQELDFEALVLDKDTMTWYLPKSKFSQWLDHEAGLPYCSDYQRQVKMRKVKLDDPADTQKCWAIYDSLNYELKVSGGYRNPSKLARHDGREWNTRQDFMYDCFTFIPRTHFVKFEFETRDVSNNIQCRYRFEAVSMGEFEINPTRILKQLRGKDTTEQIVCVKGWTLNTTKFFNPDGKMANLLEADKGETSRFLGSCRITNQDMTQDYTSSETTDDNLGYYVCSVNSANVRVFSVPHRAFMGLYAPDGGFDFDYKTQKFTPKIFQDNDGVLKLENYSGYWLSANPVSVRKRTEDTEYDTVSNYDLTFNDWFYQTGGYYYNATTPTFQTKRTLDGKSQDLMDRNDLEWTVMGGAPDSLRTGRVIGSVNYGDDLSWNGKLGYIPARFIGKHKELIKTQLGMMSIANRQLVDLQWIEWGIEQLGKISSGSQGLMHYSGTNGNYLPAQYTWDNKAITHGNITQTFTSTSVGGSVNTVNNGVGSIEYAINNFLTGSSRNVGTVKNPSRPCIDYRYFNHTRDSSSILTGLNPPNSQNTYYGDSGVGYKNVACFGQYRGRSFNTGNYPAFTMCGTEKSFYNAINALGYSSVGMMLYAPYGYDLPLGLSWNRNQADTSKSYGFNHKNNPRIQVLLCNKGAYGYWYYVLNEGVGNTAFSNSSNVVVHHSQGTHTNNSYNTNNRESNMSAGWWTARSWSQLPTISSAMGTQDGIFGGILLSNLGTRGGVCANEVSGSQTCLSLNFPSVCSPFNFSLKHGSPEDYNHQPTMLVKKKLTT